MKNTEATPTIKCEAAIQERTGWGNFYRCRNAAKSERKDYMGRPLKVCGTHARPSSSVIRYKGR